jgi:general secretion pathway protein L
MASASAASRSSGSASSRGLGHGFLSWWRRELAWFVPRFLRDSGIPADRLLWLEATPEALILSGVGASGMRELGRVDLTGNDPAAEKIAFDKAMADRKVAPFGVLVRPEQVLRKALAWPVAARENLEQVVRFEMDRQTPYRVDQVYHHAREDGVDAESGQVRVSLSVVPRHIVDKTLARLREWGVAVHAIAAHDEITKPGTYTNFLPTEACPARRSPWPALYALMAVISVSLLLAWLLLPLWRKHELLSATAPKVAVAERQARAVDILRKDLEQALGRHNYLIEKKLTTPPRLALLEDFARLLPDDTWTESLEIRGDEVVIQGETGSSSRLVGLFERSRFLGEANYRAPLVKVQNNLERFELAVALKPIALSQTLAELRAMQIPDKAEKPAKPARQGTRS